MSSINQSRKTNTHHVSTWERLPDALNRIITQTGMSEAEAKMALCQAISDGAIGIRCKLDRQAIGHLHASNTVLDGTAFQIPTEIKPEDLDWERSRPTKPWMLPREASRTPGYWHLDWIELSRTDITNAFGMGKQADPARPTRGVREQTNKRNPAKERALAVVRELYPEGVPDQAILPNVLLCSQVSARLKEKNMPGVSDDTILRAAGRRR